MVSAVYCQANPVEHKNRVKELMRCLAAHRTIIRFMQVMILPRKKISAMKIDKLWITGHKKRERKNFGNGSSSTPTAYQNVLFMQAAPSKADKDTVMVLRVFLAA
jgi:hypothetical protein